MSTKIDWADEVWNPTVGCEKVSLGCAHCYAEKWAARMVGMQAGKPGAVYNSDIVYGGRWTGNVKCLPERLDVPARWKTPRKIFVDSMSDLFHPAVPDAFITKVFKVMEDNPQHTFMVVTKRAQRMALLDLPELPNVWLGVSVENQAAAEARLPWLMMTPAGMRFVSCEPLLGPLDLQFWMPSEDGVGNKLDWVIAGCESGPGAREMDIEWVRSLRDQAFHASVPFFLKQMKVAGKLVKMPRLDGTIWDEFPCRCEHAGCRRVDATEYMLRGEEDVISHLCAEHARAEGYCLSCHEWFTEETWETGICRECTEQFNGGDEDDDPEAEYPYDWDEPVVPPDDGLLLPDSIVEQGPAE